MQSLKKLLDREIEQDPDVIGYYIFFINGETIIEKKIPVIEKNRIFSICLSIPDDTDYIFLERKENKMMIIKRRKLCFAILYQKNAKLGYIHAKTQRMLDELTVLSEILTPTEQVQEPVQETIVEAEEIILEEKPKEDFLDNNFDIESDLSVIPIPTERFDQILSFIRESPELESTSDKVIYVIALIDGETSVKDILDRLSYLDSKFILNALKLIFKKGYIKLKRGN